MLTLCWLCGDSGAAASARTVLIAILAHRVGERPLVRLRSRGSPGVIRMTGRRIAQPQAVRRTCAGSAVKCGPQFNPKPCDQPLCAPPPRPGQALLTRFAGVGRNVNPKLSTPLAIAARGSALHAQPRDKIIRLYRHVQKQVPYLLSAFGIDEPVENVRANIKTVFMKHGTEPLEVCMNKHTRMHACTPARTHARTHARTQKRTRDGITTGRCD